MCVRVCVYECNYDERVAFCALLVRMAIAFVNEMNNHSTVSNHSNNEIRLLVHKLNARLLYVCNKKSFMPLIVADDFVIRKLKTQSREKEENTVNGTKGLWCF